jgi:polyphosphate kinase
LFYFYNDGNEKIFLSSADMMQRNLDRRVEVVFPIENQQLKEELINTVIKVTLKDNVKARVLQQDGSYKFVEKAENVKTFNSQDWLMDHALKSINKKNRKVFKK